MATKYLTEEGSSMLRAYMEMYGLDLTLVDLPALIASHRHQRMMISTTLASTELAKAREQGRRQAYEEALTELTDLLKEG